LASADPTLVDDAVALTIAIEAPGAFCGLQLGQRDGLELGELPDGAAARPIETRQQRVR